MLSLHEFGEQTECDYTTASRLLSGDRAPSTGLLQRICAAYGLNANEALAALAEDRKIGSKKTLIFAAWLREHAFKETKGNQIRAGDGSHINVGEDDVTDVTPQGTLSGGQEGIKMVAEVVADRPDD